MLVAIISLKTGIVEFKYAHKAILFETGTIFMGSFVSSLALLIMSDEHYIIKKFYKDIPYPDKRTHIKKGTHVPQFILMQIFAGSYFLLCLYVGNVLYINTILSIVGTFSVLWAFDLEKSVLFRFKNGGITASLLIIFLNLYALRYYIINYREYFII